jgi:HK97 family phage prohead protease
MDIERRFAALENIEVRAEGDEPRIAGYAAVFNVLSADIGGFQERIAPGAFTRSLGRDVRALFNHDPNIVLGRTKAKTLRLEEDQRGLRVEIVPPATEAARSLVESMRRGDVDQMSFGFETVGQDWSEEGGKILRTLTEVRLFDVSIVTYPAYPQTKAAVRSLDEWRSAHRADDTMARMRMRLQLASA